MTQVNQAEAFAGLLLDKVATTLDVFGIYLGDRLGFYEVLAQDGPVTPAQLAARTGTQERYVREWMEQQAVAGVLEVYADNGARRYCLPPGNAEVLAEAASLNYMAPMVQAVAGAIRPLDRVLKAFREGGGVSFHEYGEDLREGQGRLNRAACLQLMSSAWIPAMPDIHQRLQAEGARVADVGCGFGWSAIAAALGYPKATVDGFDLDEPSIRRARENAASYMVGDRVHFHVRDAASADLRGVYDLVMALECIHDMSDPIAALAAMRRMVRPGGAVLVIDERAEEEFNPRAGSVERMLYGFSILHCLPAWMADLPSAGTGTVMRPSTFREYAAKAGFGRVEPLPVENLLFRFYRLW